MKFPCRWSFYNAYESRLHVAAVRLTAGLSQEKLAFEARLDRSYVSQLENDRKSPTIDVLFRLCEALGIRASELISRVEGRREGTT